MEPHIIYVCIVLNYTTNLQIKGNIPVFLLWQIISFWRSGSPMNSWTSWVLLWNMVLWRKLVPGLSPAPLSSSPLALCPAPWKTSHIAQAPCPSSFYTSSKQPPLEYSLRWVCTSGDRICLQKDQFQDDALALASRPFGQESLWSQVSGARPRRGWRTGSECAHSLGSMCSWPCEVGHSWRRAKLGPSKPWVSELWPPLS